MDYKSEFERGRKIAERRGRGTVGETEKATAKVRLSEAQKKAKKTSADTKAEKEAAKKASRQRAVKAARRVGGKVVRGVKGTALGLAPFAAYDVYKGRNPVEELKKDAKSMYDLVATQEGRDDLKAIGGAFVDDPGGYSEEVLDDLLRPVREKAVGKESSDAYYKRRYGYAKGGEVKGKAGHCRGGGTAIQGTKFKGVK
jgi:hypothetical protein